MRNILFRVGRRGLGIVGERNYSAPKPSHPMQMLGSDSLLREVLRKGPVVEPYNHETVAQTIAHVCKVYSEASLERDEGGTSGGGLFESIDNFRLIALQKLTERNVRILLAYHDSRLRQLSRINFARDDPGIENMAAFEISFAESYSNLVGELASQISDLIDFSVDSWAVRPPLKSFHRQ